MKYFFIIILVCLNMSLCAQDKVYHNSFSVNATTPFLKIISGFSRDTMLFFAPAIAYDRQIGAKGKLRIGITGTQSSDKDTRNGFSDKNYTVYNRYGAILTYYRIKEIDERWRFLFGPSISILYQSKDNFADSGFDLTNSYLRQQGAGVGFSTCFEYILNKKLSLYTEYSLFYTIFDIAEGKEFSAFPTENYETKKRVSNGLQLQYPMGIYLKYNF